MHTSISFITVHTHKYFRLQNTMNWSKRTPTKKMYTKQVISYLPFIANVRKISDNVIIPPHTNRRPEFY